MNQASSSDFFTVHKLADGVYATIANLGKGAWSNSGFIDLGDAVLVFDTCSTPKAARYLRDNAEKLLSKPIKYVVNSHYHGDHVFGNQVFSDSTIIATPLTRELSLKYNKIKDIDTELKDYEQYLAGIREKLKSEQNSVMINSLTIQLEEMTRVMECVPEMNLVLPNLLFDDKLVIHGSKRNIELYCFGGGHTPSDLFLYVPDCKVGFMGDLVARNSHFPIDNPENFVDILKRIQQEIEIETIVPGHGEIGTMNCLNPIVEYLCNLIEYIKRAYAEGKTLDECLKEPTPSAYSTWAGVGGYKRNVTSVYNYFQK